VTFKRLALNVSMPPPTTVDGEHYVLGRPSVRPLTLISRYLISLYTVEGFQ